MKVILIKDVKGQGKKDDIIDVSTGYANNYLIKNKLAVVYTDGSKKILEREIKERTDAEEALINECQKIRKKLENININFKVKTGKQDKVFGTISSKQISDELNKLGYKIDKKNIIINSTIDTLGTHSVIIKLHKKVECSININLTK